jgi:hypothetical protein
MLTVLWWTCWLAWGALPSKVGPAFVGPTPRATSATHSIVPVRPFPLALPSTSPPFRGYHRYRGTIGSLPVTVEVTVAPDAYGAHQSLTCRGSYFYDRRGQPLSLQAVGYQPQRPLVLRETVYLDEQARTGEWRATQPLGPHLTGTWRSADGRRQLPFLLREDYQGAVRYEVLTTVRKGPRCPDSDDHINGPYATLSRDFVHLLGPDTLRPGQRRLQCPSPTARRTQVRRAVAECIHLTEWTTISFNGHDLLSVSTSQEEAGFGRPHPSFSGADKVYNLRTGQRVTLAQLLRPGTDSLLLQLLTPRLAQYVADYFDQPLRPLTWEPHLPEGGFGLGSEGLTFSYWESDGVASWPCVGQDVVVPYAELLPLLRPVSPLTPLLRERGLQPR